MAESAEGGGAARRFVVVVGGLVASGKSTISGVLCERLGAVRLEADRVRGTLLEAAEAEPAGAEARWRRDFSPGFEQEIYGDLLRRAQTALAGGRSVVLDACFPRSAQRHAARALAARHGAVFLFAECRVPEPTARARLLAREDAVGRPGWEEIHRRLAAHFEPPDELDPDERLVVSGAGPTGPAVDAIAARLAGGRPATSVARAAASSPRFVSFDCWNTLLIEKDWPWAHALRVMALREAAREAGCPLSDEEAERVFNAAWQQHVLRWEAGEATGAPEVATWALAALGLEGAHPAREHLVRRFEEASHTGHVMALEGACGLLAALDAAGTPCVLVCDTGLTPGRVVRQLLDRVGLLAHLRVQAFSDEVGAPKPDRRPFLAALEPLGIAPEHGLHVGDLRRTDVAGARELGMHTVRIRAPHDDTSDGPEADWVVSSYSELARLLGVPVSGKIS